MPRVPGDVPQVPFQPTQMPGYQAPVVQPSQNFMPQQLQQLAGGLQDVGQASSRIGSSMQRQDLAEKEAMEAKAREQERIQARLQQEQDRLDETEAKNKINEYRKFAITKRTEFGRLEGASAPQQYSKYIKDIKDYGDELYKGLANDTQRKIFSSSRDIFEFDTTSAMDSHSYNENKRYQRETNQSSAQINSQAYTDSFVEATRNARLDVAKGMIGLPQSRIDPNAYREAMKADIRNSMEGQPEESIKVEIDKALKSTHANTLEALAASKEYGGINKYISLYGKEIDPKVASQYGQIATEALDTFDATRIAIGIAAPFREADGFLSEENYAQVVAEMQRRYASKELKVSEDKLNKILSSLLSIKQSDSSLRTRAEAELVQQASRQIEFQKSFEARNGYASWIDQTQRQSVAEQFGASIADGPVEDPAVIPIVSDDAGNAMEAFKRTNPILHARLAAAGKLKDLEDNLRGGGKSDPSAIAELERNINDDPSFAAKYSLDSFDSNYGLRLNQRDYELYRNKFVAAQSKGAEQANAMSENSMNLMLNRSLLDNKLVVDLTGKVADEDNEESVSATKADIRHEWEAFSAEFKSRNPGKSPGRDEFSSFLESYWKTRKDTGIDKPVSQFSAEDRSKVFVSYTDRISGKTHATSLEDIDEELYDKAAARVNDLNNRLYAVKADGITLERFATRAEAEEYRGSRMARNRAANNGILTDDFEVEKQPIISTSRNSKELGTIALEILANEEYKSAKDTGGFTLKAPDTSKRTNAILEFYGSRKSDAAAKDGVAGNILSFAIASASPLSYEGVKKARQEVRVATEESFRKKVESIRDDIANDSFTPNSRISTDEVADFSTALTGYSADRLVSMGALKPVYKLKGDTVKGALEYYVTTSKFEDIVKETYDYTVQVLKKQGYR